MIIDDTHYDVIIIGSGAAGGTLAGRLAGRGRRVLLLERGGQLPLVDQNVADVDLFRKDRYHPARETWMGPDADPFAPQTIYALGGNSKIWGGVLERLREGDFQEHPLQEGTAPAWPLSYQDLAPWYGAAEQLYRVHGAAGADPTEPPREGAYAQAPRPIEPFLTPVGEALERAGCHPYRLPISWSDQAEDPSGDAEVFRIAAAVADPQLQLQTEAIVTRLHVNPAGTRVSGVQASVRGQEWLFRGDRIVLAAGAVNTAALLLRSVSDRHPRGLGNVSDLVGRHLMRPQLTSILQLTAVANSGRYGRSWAVNDYYWGDRNVSYPLGQVRSAGGVLQDPLFAESPPVLSLVTRLLPGFGLDQLASRSLAWWASTPVAPDRHNKVWLNGERLHINYLANNREAHDRLVYRWLDTLKAVEADPLVHVLQSAPVHPRGEAPIQVMGYACGTCRMGDDPTTSVVDSSGRCHELENLYVADASVFPSCPAVGPGLTVIALALRLGDHLAVATS
ncbi:MAG: GMC oxidoreductase [Cyanobacteriota bacterium]